MAENPFELRDPPGPSIPCCHQACGICGARDLHGQLFAASGIVVLDSHVATCGQYCRGGRRQPRGRSSQARHTSGDCQACQDTFEELAANRVARAMGDRKPDLLDEFLEQQMRRFER